MRRNKARQVGTVALQPVGVDDEAVVDRLLDGLKDYSMKVDGVSKLVGGAHRFLTATPSGYGRESKYTFVVRLKGEDVGLVDVIRGYPEASTSFIGLLAIIETHQRRGIGRAAFRAVERFARNRLGACKLRLAVVATNPVMGFWRAMGFHETDEVRPYNDERISSTVHPMEKRIAAGRAPDG
ncbi:GNAT family N-acetyltransferase [Bradyrhizobium tunisiense]|uniref:GNAT family N-acetyltransferase n=1 Tax=Bradyrhizobium tunisiense TaxID=3278709 RepID=UPI0035D656FA